jgi:hypothetical protein
MMDETWDLAVIDHQNTGSDRRPRKSGSLRTPARQPTRHSWCRAPH